MIYDPNQDWAGMTEKATPREGRPLRPDEVTPTGAGAQLMFRRIKNILLKAGAEEVVAEELALRIWRVTRDG